MRKVYLVGRSGIHGNKELLVENEIIIGRDAAVAQLVYPGSERGISSVHCKVSNVNGNIQLTDMGSTNGTFLDTGVRLAPHSPQTLSSGQGFYLGDRANSFAIRVQDDVASAPSANQVSGVQAKPQLSGTKAFSIASLVLGIVGIVFLFSIFLPIITGTLGTIFGGYALYTKKRGKGMAIAGLVCSIISLTISLLMLLASVAGITILSSLF